MILLFAVNRTVPMGIPRESGDDPNGTASLCGVLKYSPRERG